MKDIADGLMRMARSMVSVDRINEMCRLLFESRDAAHLWHLQTDSFAMHKALDSYYKEILEHADDFLESAQGLFPRMTGGFRTEIPDYRDAEQVKDHLNELREELALHRTNFPNELQNIIDEMISLIDKTLYFLTLG